MRLACEPKQHTYRLNRIVKRAPDTPILLLSDHSNVAVKLNCSENFIFVYLLTRYTLVLLYTHYVCTHGLDFPNAYTTTITKTVSLFEKIFGSVFSFSFLFIAKSSICLFRCLTHMFSSLSRQIFQIIYSPVSFLCHMIPITCMFIIRFCLFYSIKIYCSYDGNHIEFLRYQFSFADIQICVPTEV